MVHVTFLSVQFGEITVFFSFDLMVCTLLYGRKYICTIISHFLGQNSTSSLSWGQFGEMTTFSLFDLMVCTHLYGRNIT